jgi:tripartite-type tricarboxylate transporter receptor subunit TctC
VIRIVRCFVLGLVLCIATGFTAVRADDFFRGKTINLYVGSTPGGPYDAYARMVARYMGKHLAGNPTFVVSNMAGASGRKLMGFMYNIAPKDGTAIALVQRALAFDPLLGTESNFDPSKVTWLGSANDETNICIVWHTSPIQTIDDVKKMTMNVGSGGPASTDTIYPMIMNHLFGTKFNVINGYPAAAETQLAMQRGEVDGRCGITWDTLQSMAPQWIAEKKVRILVQFALEKHPDLPDVPSVFDLATTEEQRQILTFWAAPNKMGRPFFAPPNMAPDRADMLRQAFDETLKDPELLAEVERTKLLVHPTSGKEVETLIKRVYATPKDIIEKAAAASR